MIYKQIIPALDIQDEKSLRFLVDELANEADIVKVGMELFYSHGKLALQLLQERELKIFLDLKLHDIPNTVGKAAKTLAKSGVEILNVHAAGGVEMMKCALDNFKTENPSGKLIGVTQLTSTSQSVMNTQLGIPGNIDDVVIRYAESVRTAGLDGVVCSALEVKRIKSLFGSDFLCITPGIRPKGCASDDQKRIMTPTQALQAGSDYLVIGRAITNEKSPKIAFQKILKDTQNELDC